MDGNTTGISILAPELDGKRQQILVELLPNAHRMAILTDSEQTPAHLERLFRLAASDCPHSFNEWDAANAELKALGVVP